MGAFLYAAEAANHAAVALRRTGELRRATQLEQTSHAHAAHCNGAATPALTPSRAQAPLTAREREIALLAAKGLASKVIARNTELSTRTVDNYLQRIYDKLGIHTRSDLAAALTTADSTAFPQDHVHPLIEPP